MPEKTAHDTNGEEFARRLEQALQAFENPHPAAVKFLREADQAQGCQRHVMLCARSMSSVGCMPPPAQESTYKFIMQNLEESMEGENCWPALKPVLSQHWREFSVPPPDCQSQAHSLIHSFTSPVGKYTAECRQPANANAMQAEALEAIMQATEHMVVSLAGNFVRYSLTSSSYRPKYSQRLLGRLRTRIDAINHLDQNCAFALHAVDRWENAHYYDDALAKLMLWGDRVNSAEFRAQEHGESRNAALVMAKRRLGNVVEAIIKQETPPTPTERTTACQTAAYWVEVSHNLTPASDYAKQMYGIDEIPNLSPSSDF